MNECPYDEHTYIKAAELEISQGNIGTIDEENSARWILNKGMKECPSDVNIYIKSSELEINLENVGTIDEENSARWILNKGMKECPSDVNIYIKSSELEINLGNVGTIDEENSARWILNKGMKECSNDVNMYIRAAELEINQGNIGTIDEKNSARWIISQFINNNDCLNDDFINVFDILLDAESRNIEKVDQYIKTYTGIGDIRNYYIAYLCYDILDIKEKVKYYKNKLTDEDIERYKEEKFFKYKLWKEGWVDRMRFT